MSQPGQSVREFVADSYQLVSAATPTVPLHGNDLSKGIQFLNELLASYSSSGLLITVEKLVEVDVVQAEGLITFGPANYSPTPTVTSEGRLANIENAWVNLEGVDYPLVPEQRSEFQSSYKYAPLEGLPRYVIYYPGTNITTLQIYPAPSQLYTLFVYGKFQLNTLTANDDMSSLPTYYIRYLRFALAKDVAMYKGRASAWTEVLEGMLQKATDDMVAASGINLDININQESWLNGAWRVRSGI